MDIKFFNSDKKLKVDKNKLILIGSQENYLIYEYESFLVKVIIDITKVNKDFNDFVEKIDFVYKILNDSEVEYYVKKSLSNSLPIGYFIDEGKIFSKGNLNLVILYNKIDLIDLETFLINEDVMNVKRIETYNKLIDLLIFLQQNKILICDYTLNNFAVFFEGETFFVVIKDLTKFCIDHIKDIRFVKSDFILPPETFFKNEYNMYSEIWLSTNLIFWVLTGFSAFDFIKIGNINHNIIQNFLYHVDYRIKTWPPLVKQGINISSQLYYLDQIKYNNLQRICKDFFKYSNFKELLFRNFVLGYLLFNQRKNLTNIKNELIKDISKISKKLDDLKQEKKQEIYQEVKQTTELQDITELQTIPDYPKQEKTNLEIKSEIKSEIKTESKLETNFVSRIEPETKVTNLPTYESIDELISSKLKALKISNIKPILFEFLKKIFITLPLNLDLFDNYKLNILFEIFNFIDKKQNEIKNKYDLDDKEYYLFKVAIVNFIQYSQSDNLKKILNIFYMLYRYKYKSYEELIYLIYERFRKDLINAQSTTNINEVNLKIRNYISKIINENLYNYFESYYKKVKSFIVVLIILFSVINVFLFFKNFVLFLIFFVINFGVLMVGIFGIKRYLKWVIEKERV